MPSSARGARIRPWSCRVMAASLAADVGRPAPHHPRLPMRSGSICDFLETLAISNDDGLAVAGEDPVRCPAAEEEIDLLATGTDQPAEIALRQGLADPRSSAGDPVATRKLEKQTGQASLDGKQCSAFDLVVGGAQAAADDLGQPDGGVRRLAQQRQEIAPIKRQHHAVAE